MTLFGVRLPSLRAPRQHAPAPPPPIDLAAAVADTFFVVAYYRDGARPRTVTYTRALGSVGATVERELAAGATHIEVEPEWSWRPVGAA